MVSFGKWLREGGVRIDYDEESEPLWKRILQLVPPFRQAEERERYSRKPYEEEEKD